MTTNREEFLKKMGLDVNKSYSIEELSKVSGVKKSILDEVAKRSAGAYSSNLGSVRLLNFSKNPDVKKFPASKRLSLNQWKMARVFSFLNKGKTYYTADADLAQRV